MLKTLLQLKAMVKNNTAMLTLLSEKLKQGEQEFSEEDFGLPVDSFESMNTLEEKLLQKQSVKKLVSIIS